ncbi:hypothetical protein BU16DRAFT_593821 [Lophium mytilinum]|uniref:BZIP domain-containing protein n=1 Tax=Lophium mytilinum TaxID=390894 RepID=A0A6A6QJR6_9PEZI|nr:hypothetical protein BU16DRAFT_593821 [Lophium mytilinum]
MNAQPAKRDSNCVSEKRKEQNRQSQRVYREKKKKRLQNLERLAASQKWAEIAGSSSASDTFPSEQSTLYLPRPVGLIESRMTRRQPLDLQAPISVKDQVLGGAERVPIDNSATPAVEPPSKPFAPHLHDYPGRSHQALPSSFSIMNSPRQTDSPIDTASFDTYPGIPYGRFNTFKIPQQH